ncbi:MAG: hypothetical protein WBN03_12820 [Desulfobacterales bacterium]
MIFDHLGYFDTGMTEYPIKYPPFFRVGHVVSLAGAPEVPDCVVAGVHLFENTPDAFKGIGIIALDLSSRNAVPFGDLSKRQIQEKVFAEYAGLFQLGNPISNLWSAWLI